MAKPRHPVDNRPDQSEGPGDRGAEAEVLVADVETGGVTQGDKAAGPPSPPISKDRHQERNNLTKSGARTETEEDKENGEERHRDRENPSGAQKKVFCVGGEVTHP